MSSRFLNRIAWERYEAERRDRRRQRGWGMSKLSPFVVLAGFLVGLYACSPTLAPAMSGMRHLPKAAPGIPPTNSKEISEWIARLTTHINGGCCGEGDAYPIEISEMPTCKEGLYDKDPGTATVTNPAPVDIVTQNLEIIHKPQIHGPLTFTFGCSKVTHEKYGNPLKTAIAFLSVDTLGNIQVVYCVVPLPPGS
jgi:hypothetical protein